MAEERRGRQKPTTSFILPYRETKGTGAVELYNRTGRTAQEWQELLIYDILAVNDDGLWVHTKFGHSLPRRNGKNEVVAIRELFGLFRGKRILYTAHRTTTSRSAWERLCRMLSANGIKEAKYNVEDGYKTGKSKGQEFIELSPELGGGRIDSEPESPQAASAKGLTYWLSTRRRSIRPIRKVP